MITGLPLARIPQATAARRKSPGAVWSKEHRTSTLASDLRAAGIFTLVTGDGAARLGLVPQRTTSAICGRGTGTYERELWAG